MLLSEYLLVFFDKFASFLFLSIKSSKGSISGLLSDDNKEGKIMETNFSIRASFVDNPVAT